MAYRCLFMDNDIYTAQDVNDAISNIVSGGICGYPLGNGAMSDLNSAIAELTNGGTEYKATACLLINDRGTYKISEGACIMNDGTQIIFDSDGYEITHESGEYEYVYLQRDVLHNRINVVVSQEAGGQGTIPIAEIKADGTILDRRRFASAKISLAAEPENIGITKRITSPRNIIYPGDYFEFDIGFGGWEYIICSSRAIKLPDGASTRGFPIRNSDGYSDSATLVTRNGSILHFENTADRNAPGIDVEIEVR